MKKYRVNSIIIGVFMLLAFVVYGGGQSMVSNVLDQSVGGVVSIENRLPVVLGAALMLLNSCMVIGIGMAMKPVLKQCKPTTANVYFATRVLEGIFLAAGALGFLRLAIDGGRIFGIAEANQINNYAYQIGMLILGIGSLFLCRAMIACKIVPSWMAIWGMAGYAVFALGCIAELLGVPIGMYMQIPGGLFEIVFAIWLLAKGFHFDEATTA